MCIRDRPGSRYDAKGRKRYNPDNFQRQSGVQTKYDAPTPLPRQKDFSLDPIIKNVKKKKKRGGSFKESTLFERIKSKSFFNPKDIKPTFPENPPPKLDPKTGMHPDYGKSAKRYKKLDPASANAMPRTGDPETDAIVDKQRTKPRKN